MPVANKSSRSNTRLGRNTSILGKGRSPSIQVDEDVSLPDLPLHLPWSSSVTLENVSKSICLPSGEDSNEWIQINLEDFVTQSHFFKADFNEFCSPDSCPHSSVGERLKYVWVTKDGKAVEMPARIYFNTVMTWADETLSNKQLFPSGPPYPRHFLREAKLVFDRILRFYLHMYFHHYEEIVSHRDDDRFNGAFLHLVSFMKLFNLTTPSTHPPAVVVFSLIERSLNGESLLEEAKPQKVTSKKAKMSTVDEFEENDDHLTELREDDVFLEEKDKPPPKKGCCIVM